MKLPRVRFTVRRMMVAVAIVGLLVGSVTLMRRRAYYQHKVALHRERQESCLEMARAVGRRLEQLDASGIRGLAAPLLAYQGEMRARAEHSAALAAKFRRAARTPGSRSSPT